MCFIDTNARVGYIVGCISGPTVVGNLIGVVAVMAVLFVLVAVLAAVGVGVGVGGGGGAGGGRCQWWRGV